MLKKAPHFRVDFSLILWRNLRGNVEESILLFMVLICEDFGARLIFLEKRGKNEAGFIEHRGD